MNYFRVALSNKNRKMKKLRENETVEMHRAAS